MGGIFKWIIVTALFWGGTAGCDLSLLRRNVPIRLASTKNDSGSYVAYEYYAYAELSYEFKNIEQAISWLESAIEADPKDAYLHSRLAVLLLETGEEERALAEIKRGLAKNPEVGYGWLALSAYHLQHGDFAKAEEAGAKALNAANVPRDAPIWVARLQNQQGNKREAARILEAEVQKNPLNTEARLALAETKLSLHDLAGARRHLMLYLESRSVPLEFVSSLVEAHLSKGKREEAAFLMELALAEQGYDSALRFRLIDLLLDLGQTARARHHLDSVEIPKEENVLGRLKMAKLNLRVSRPYAARKLLATELPTGDMPQSIRLALATVEITLGRLEAASLLLQRDDFKDDACRNALQKSLETWQTKIPYCAFEPTE